MTSCHDNHSSLYVLDVCCVLKRPEGCVTVPVFTLSHCSTYHDSVVHYSKHSIHPITPRHVLCTCLI